MSKPLVAIVGRPNVGKSTLFNRIIGARRAIVDDQPGVTRDRHYADADWAGREFMLIDTGGYVTDSSDVFEKAIREQVVASIEEATVLVFVVDAKHGLHPMDLEIAQLLRKSRRKVVLAVNKVDTNKVSPEAAQFYELGLGDPYEVSAATGRSSGDLLDVIVAGFPEVSDLEEERHLHLAVIGRPNVGKSSIVNAMLGRERSIVTPIAGTTRDALDTPFNYFGQEITLIDTAGLRRKSKITENIEFFSTLRTFKSIERCDVALCLVDATEGLLHQDIDIISDAIGHHKGVVICVNKWDLLEEKDSNTAKRIEDDIAARVKMYDYVPVVFVSALTRQRVTKALDTCIEVYHERQKRVSTSELNDRLLEVVRATPPPSTPTGREVKIYYVTQVRESPPVIVLFTNEPKHIPESYKRFVERAIRRMFGFIGVPIAVQFRQK